MAGDWMKIEKDTPHKPETIAIAAALNITTDEAFGKCFRMWSWFDSHTVDGNASSVTKILLDAQVGVTGLCDAMESVGWLACSDEGIQLTNFDRHNGETAKQRALTAKRVKKNKAKSNAKGNDSSESVALPREEKRREEYTTGRGNVFSKISDSMLRDVAKVIDWFEQASSGSNPVVPPGDGSLESIVGMARQVSTRKGIKNPSALFVSSIKNNRFDLDDAEKDWAKLAVGAHRKGLPPPTGLRIEKPYSPHGLPD